MDLAAHIRLYSATERIWLDSGDIVARLAVKKGYERRKIQELAFDALIVLTVHSIGAAVVTLDRQDFEDLRQYRRFRLACWE